VAQTAAGQAVLSGQATADQEQAGPAALQAASDELAAQGSATNDAASCGLAGVCPGGDAVSGEDWQAATAPRGSASNVTTRARVIGSSGRVMEQATGQPETIADLRRFGPAPAAAAQKSESGSGIRQLLQRGPQPTSRTATPGGGASVNAPAGGVAPIVRSRNRISTPSSKLPFPSANRMVPGSHSSPVRVRSS
jgi:hypothetical protein